MKLADYYDDLRAEAIRRNFANPRVRERQVTTSPVRNTRRVERTLKLIALLSDWQTNKAMAQHLELHPKSINRYLNMLSDLGFVIQWTSLGRYNYYRIANAKEYFRSE